MKKLLSLTVLLFVFGVISCNKKEVGANMRSEKKYSGEQLFRGIFFLQGEVAEKIPSYQSILGDTQIKSNLQSSESIEFRESIFSKLSSEQPQLLQTLEKAINDRDRFKTTEVLKTINDHIKKKLERENFLSSQLNSGDITSINKNGTLLENADMNRIDQRCGFAVVCVAYAAVAVHNAVAVTTFAVAAIGGAIWGGVALYESLYWRATSEDFSSLKMEKFVEEIIQAAQIE